MACTTITGDISIGCLGNLGGLTKLYIANLEDITSFTDTGSDGDIDTITMVSGKVFYEIELLANTSDYKEEYSFTPDSGAKFYKQIVTLKLPRREAAKRQQLALLASGKFVLIAKDANGIFWLMGETNGLYMSKNEGGSGTKQEDGSSYTIEFTAIGEPDPAKEVLFSAVAAVI